MDLAPLNVISSTIWLMALKSCTKRCSFVPGFCMGRTGVSRGDWQGQINWNLREMIIRGFIPSLACLFKGYCFKFAALAPEQSWLSSWPSLGTHQPRHLFLRFVEFLQGLLVEACLPIVIAQLGRCKLFLVIKSFNFVSRSHLQRSRTFSKMKKAVL